MSLLLILELYHEPGGIPKLVDNFSKIGNNRKTEINIRNIT